MDVRPFRRHCAALPLAALTAAFVALAAVPAQAQGVGRAAGLPDFTDLYERQGPAVVSIDVTQTVKRSPRGMPDLSEDDPFY